MSNISNPKFHLSRDILAHYSNVFKCSHYECNDHYALNNPNHKKCYVPRDFFGYYEPPKKILVIGMNPGKILKSETREYSKIHNSPGNVTQAEAEQMVYKHLELAEEMFHKGMHIQDNRLRLSFHIHFPEAISKILNIDVDDIFDYIYYTNMVKCQTKRVLTKLKMEDRTYLIENCYNLHLKKEIELLRPDLILTYGHIVYESLPWRDLIPIKVFNIPYIWAEASYLQRKEWRDQLDVMQNNLAPIISQIKRDMQEEQEKRQKDVKLDNLKDLNEPIQVDGNQLS